MQLAALRMVYLRRERKKKSDDKFMQDGSSTTAPDDENKQTCCLKLVFFYLNTIHKNTMRANGFIHHTFTYNPGPFLCLLLLLAAARFARASPFGWHMEHKKACGISCHIPYCMFLHFALIKVVMMIDCWHHVRQTPFAYDCKKTPVRCATCTQQVSKMALCMEQVFFHPPQPDT